MAAICQLWGHYLYPLPKIFSIPIFRISAINRIPILHRGFMVLKRSKCQVGTKSLNLWIVFPLLRCWTLRWSLGRCLNLCFHPKKAWFLDLQTIFTVHKTPSSIFLKLPFYKKVLETSSQLFFFGWPNLWSNRCLDHEPFSQLLLVMSGGEQWKIFQFQLGYTLFPSECKIGQNPSKSQKFLQISS